MQHLEYVIRCENCDLVLLNIHIPDKFIASILKIQRAK